VVEIEEISQKKSAFFIVSGFSSGLHEQLGDGLLEGAGQAFEAVEGRATLAPLDEIEEVEQARWTPSPQGQ